MSLRCCDTAGRLTGTCLASSLTVASESRSCSKIARRVGSARASSAFCRFTIGLGLPCQPERQLEESPQVSMNLRMMAVNAAVRRRARPPASLANCSEVLFDVPVDLGELSAARYVEP